jgi:hypothetical protein
MEARAFYATMAERERAMGRAALVSVGVGLAVVALLMVLFR